MTKEKFIDCLRDPSLLHENEIRELHQLVSKYPYFQGARALLAKVSKERNLKDAPLRISSAAVYTTDRALLKKYISDHLFFLDSREAVKEKKVRKPEPSKPQQVSRPPSSPTGKPKSPPSDSAPKSAPKEKPVRPDRPVPPRQPAPKAQEPQKKPPRTEPASKPPKPEEELVDLKQSETNLDDWLKEIYEDIEALKKSKARFQELEKKLEEEEAVNAALERVAASAKPTSEKTEKVEAKDVSDTTEETASKEKKKTTSKKSASVSSSTETKKTTTKSKKSTTKSAKEKDEAPKSSTSRRKKTATTAEKAEKAPKATKSTRKKSTETKDKEVTPKVKEPKSTTETNEVKATTKAKETSKTKKADETKESKTPEKADDGDTLKVVRRRSGKVQSTTYETKSEEKEEKENEQIIDKFISENPKISKADKSMINADKGEKEDLADKSSRFQADIGSEYLAEIYVEQGKIDRAILIYEKLSLKFPEKKSYFVARIEELKSK